MSINTKEFATKFTSELDKVLCGNAAVGFMTDNAFRAQFVGAKTVKVPTIAMEGLGDYDRNTGFIDGAVNVSNSIYEMKQDRARTFSIDREDMDETGIAELAGNVMSEFVRTKVVPETDAYVLSKLAGLAQSRAQVVSANTQKPFETFSDMLEQVQSACGFDEEIVCFVNPKMWNAFRTSDEFVRYISTGDFVNGEITTQVHKIDNVDIIPVSAKRMQSAYEFLSGKDAEKCGGFKVADSAKGVYMLMLPKKAAALIRKSETIRTFLPEQNPSADAYKFDYRLYYDVFVKTSYLSSVFAAFAPSVTVTSDVSASKTVSAGSISGSLSITASSDTGTLTYQWFKCEDALATNSAMIAGENAASMKLDTKLEKGEYFFFVRVSADGASVVDSNVCVVTVE